MDEDLFGVEDLMKESEETRVWLGGSVESKPIFGPYVVTSEGKVYKDDRELKQTLTIRKYKGKEWRSMCVSLMVDGKFRNFGVHRLVAEAFVENPHGYKDVVKIEGDSCAASNLKWASRSETMKAAMAGKVPKGAKHWKTGTEVSKETRHKMRQAKLGKKHPQYKGTYICDGKSFDSASAAAEHFKISITTVIRRCMMPKEKKKKDYKAWYFIPKQ